MDIYIDKKAEEYIKSKSQDKAIRVSINQVGRG